MIFRTRFAPSPTGPLHLGHAYSALLAHDMAERAGGVFHLRIDDIDQSRARPHWEAQIYDDLHWLGIDWPAPVWRQSERADRYCATLQRLWARGLLYPCTCTRRDIAAAANAPQEGAPIHGPDGLVYPGTCREKPLPAVMPTDCALRLNMRNALQEIDKASFQETGTQPGTHKIRAEQMLDQIGDVVLARRDMAASYHLSIVLDDADQEITHVVRGEDLFEATKIHVVLQSLLNLPTPIYHHHRLIRDDAGKRLAKRDDARAIATYRAEGKTPQDIRAMVGL
ncbi:tRNA glutamyl-Q(34) synthetase GluQRS [Primorskyibacter aestuariivivens]|uniref:tRNA glutamyl-Q(34) synthetase GluQRS n=1 Tax=Primorskyibacter aestuariivivens TaxID=1888912 RepID=UPI0023008C00|nr:tRNA glutamyl-Q(34) synthetase GluQRS [Primorskyibacter aestuariivivens]MDA7427008.1 tRNA glutamyl-Q(34) synthetase GluQRS [Primorskyibacter aestuariivivens]